jgi:meso-butanediol dehydrogenase/(S,S)-butanediol dehydrogenase/diacetyl reductase
VTGGASGIGLATARRLAADGADVYLLDLDEEGARAAVEAHALRGYAVGDVSTGADVARTVAEIQSAGGRIRIVVNCAGIEIRGGVEELSEEDWDRQFAVTTKSIFLVSKACIPDLLETGGVIVNIASDAGLTGDVGIDAYVAAKHAVVGLTRCMALTLGERGVRVNAVCPGMTRTPMSERHIAAEPTHDDRFYARLVPMGRLGKPEDVAAAVAYLVSDDASYVNGELLSVDGGAMAGYFIRD